MYWIIVNEKYLDFLRERESRIPYTDYGDDKLKPFFGVLFERDGLCYVTQVAHPRQRHYKLRQQKDFYKLYDPRQKDRLMAVVNLNYMFPVPKADMEKFEKSKIEAYRTFASERDKTLYIDLLDKELKVINHLHLSEAAEKLYELKENYPEDRISKRCFDFKKLEYYAFEWEKK